MPKRSGIEKFRLPGRWARKSPFYTEADFEEILKATPPLPAGEVFHRRVAAGGGFEDVRVPRRQALVEQLESAARTYTCMHDWQFAPTPLQLANRYRRIETAAAKLLAALGTPNGELDELPEALRLGQPPGRNDLRAVERIRQWARDHVSWAESRPSTPAHSADEALDDFVSNMAATWRDVLGRSPGRSAGNGRHGGPFARFVREALRPLCQSNVPTEAQIADRVKKLKNMGKLLA